MATCASIRHPLEAVVGVGKGTTTLNEEVFLLPFNQERPRISLKCTMPRKKGRHKRWPRYYELLCRAAWGC